MNKKTSTALSWCITKSTRRWSYVKSFWQRVMNPNAFSIVPPICRTINGSPQCVEQQLKR